MRFYYTEGKEARYLVGSYNFTPSFDLYYTHYLKDAQRIFNDIKGYALTEGKGKSISVKIQDIKKGIVKAYWEAEE